MSDLRLILNENEEFDFGLEQSYFVKNTHAQNRRFKMLPYTTTGKNKDYVVDFTGVVGEFIRVLGDNKLSEKFDIALFKQNLKELLEDSDYSDELLNVVEKLFVDGDNLAMFDLKSLNYVKADNSEIKMAHFLYTMLANKEIRAEFKVLNEGVDTNVLHRLVYDALPKLEIKDYKCENTKYNCLIPFVKDLFFRDFMYLMSDQGLVEKYFKRILEYYYMFYVTQLTIKLNHFEKADFEKVEKIYMTLSWEITSQTRRSYEYGWQYVKEHLDKLFSHAITFEVLAHNNLDEKFTYTTVDSYEGDYSEIVREIDWFINRYKSMKKDVDFTSYRFDEEKKSNSEFTSKTKELFEIIYYQFRNSGRSIQNKRYYDSVVKFVHSNFGKRRGRSGYSFNITENDIIMFVQIILGQSDGRIRLVALFSEFENRGLLFDRESKNKIVELLEKLNLLEKKSDSGDAQYVRSIL